MKLRGASAPYLLVVLTATCSNLAAARELKVGIGQAYQVPSAAAAVAQDGDTVSILPGTYYDCAFWSASRLTVAGTGPDAVISDRACAGKAAFVITGDAVVVRSLVFTRIRVPDGNGAGIRAEGNDLNVEDSRFVNNQIGILAGGPGGSLRISRCSFIDNGVSLASEANPAGQPTHGVSGGKLDLLQIDHSIFEKARGGDYIASAALRTELIGNRLADAGQAMVGPLVSAHGGTVVLDGNTLELAADAADRPGAVLVTGEATSILVHGNTLIEPLGDVPLLRNWTGLTASQTDNVVPKNAVAVSDSGSTYHRLRSRTAKLFSQAHGIFGKIRHLLAELARKLAASA